MSKEHREFWIDDGLLRDEKGTPWMAVLYDHYKGMVGDGHFIEYSAYETLTAKVKLLEDELSEQCRINGMGAQRELALITKVKRYEDAMVHIHKMGCAYKGNLTGCPACYICNEFPEFNEMNKRDRSEHGNN